MRDTCRVRSARVIRAKFLAMHFPRTCRPTDVDVALSPLLGRCSALVYYYYHYYYCYYRDGVALSLVLCHCSIYIPAVVDEEEEQVVSVTTVRIMAAGRR